MESLIKKTPKGQGLFRPKKHRKNITEKNEGPRTFLVKKKGGTMTFLKKTERKKQ